MIRALKINDPILADNGQLVANTYAVFPPNSEIILRVGTENDFNIKSSLNFYKSEADYANGAQPIFSTMVHAIIPCSESSKTNFFDHLYMSFVSGEFFNLDIIYN